MKVFTTGQVAAICKVAPRTVSKWFDTGRLKGYRIPGGQDRRITLDSLVQFLRENSMPTDGVNDLTTISTAVFSVDEKLIARLKQEIQTAPHFTFSAVGNSFDMGMLIRDKRPDVVIVDFAVDVAEANQICKAIQTHFHLFFNYVIAIDPPATVNRSTISETARRPVDARLIADRIKEVILPRKHLA